MTTDLTEHLEGFTPSEQKALRLTVTLETGRTTGFDVLAGDFDKMGLSFGLLQWNFGSGSLQPLLKRFAERAPDRFNAVFGPHAGELLGVLRGGDLAGQVAFARSLNGGGPKIGEPWKGYFTALGTEPGFRRIQIEEARKSMDRARDYARTYRLTSERGFALMFDTVNSHGRSWDAKLDRDDLVAATLATAASPTERDIMEAIANVVADTSSAKWRERVRVRKLMFVNGAGKVHGTDHDLARDFGIGDAAWDTGATASAAPTLPSPAPSPPAGTGWSFDKVVDLVRSGLESVGLMQAIVGGNRDENSLADMLFFARHPERNSRKIDRSESGLAKEWMQIRDSVIRPALRRAEQWVPADDEGPGTQDQPDADEARADEADPVDAVSNRPTAPTPAAPVSSAGPVLSPLAVWPRGLRRATQRRTRPFGGIVVHTTGGGPAEKARKKPARTAADYALDYYVLGGGGFPHYLVDYDGTIFGVCDENYVAWHAGWGKKGARQYDGWAAPSWWSNVWAPARTPVDLMPAGRTPNSYVGIEMLGDATRLFKDAQYVALGRLLADLITRHGLDVTSAPSRTLLGHEDVHPNERDDAGGGWDPGAHRDKPRFDWARVWAETQKSR